MYCSTVCVNAWEREYLQESQRCSVKGVQIKHLVSSSVLKGYNERFKHNYLPFTSSPQALRSGVQCQP